MLGYFRRLEERSQALGNHARKHLFGIDRFGRKLIDRLEASGRFDRVRLLQIAPNVGVEMDAVLEAGQDEREKLALLGCYQAIQFLHMNIRSIDFLRSSSLKAEDPSTVYRDFIQMAQDDFSILIREYLGRLLDLLLAGHPRPEFVVCFVGTRLHQDDVDLGIIDDGGPARDHLNGALGRLAQEMMRWSSTPDFYLSEHVGNRGYSVSIDEYLDRLDSRILDFVSVSEILSAHPIVGSTRLYEQFRREVHKRFYYGRRKLHREHEGYLRGLLGEIESLILWPKNPKLISPKEDLLRLVTAILWAYRTVDRVTEPDTDHAFEQLGRASAAGGALFQALEQHYTFVETFRHLYQQFSAQQETIDLTDPKEQEALEQVARTMGYEDVGVIRAWQQLLVRYIEHTRAGRKIVEALVPHVRDHIKKVTVFREWLGLLTAGQSGEGRRRPALDFLERVRYFQGIKYWHDLLDELEAEEGRLLGALIADLKAMEESRREGVLEDYADWGHETFFTLLRFLTIIGKSAKKYEAEQIFRLFNAVFLRSIEGTPDETRRFSTVFMYIPALVYRYLSMVDEDTHRYLHEKFSGAVWDPQVAAWQRRLLNLFEVIRRSSRFFRRVLDRVSDRHPECLMNLAQLDELERVARGIFADLVRLPSYEEQRVELGTYYDVQILRIGLGTLRGLPLAQLDGEFAEFSDQYIRILFDICKAEVDKDLDRRIYTHDLLGVFVAGGHGRERAHQDDYDLIVLLNSESDEILQYSNRILTRLNREIVKRGIIPQYRLGDLFGGYVTRFSELERYLQGNAEETFIEASQLLGARMVVGSSRLESQFRKRIIEELIFSQKRIYFRAMAREIIERRKVKGRLGNAMNFDVKESEGGLRDLEMAMLLLKVRHEVEGPVGTAFLNRLAERLPQERQALVELQESYQFLNRLRDVYRLTVCPSNFLDPAHFEQPALLLGYEDSGGMTAGERLRGDFQAHCSRTAARLYALIETTLAS